MKKNHFKAFVISQFVLISAFTVAHALQNDNPNYVPQNPGYASQNPGYAPQNPGYGSHNPGYASQNPGYGSH